MADKVVVRERLRALKLQNITHRVVADKFNLELVYLQDYTNNDFAKFIIPHKNLLSMPKNDDGVVPIGLVQIDVPYEFISTIEIFGIEDTLLTKLEQENPEVLRRYNLGNRTKGIKHGFQKELMGIDKLKDGENSKDYESD